MRPLHHAKIMLLEFEYCLRVIVGTANLQGDFETKTNAVWMQDFPRFAPMGATTSTPKGVDFRENLKRYLLSIGQQFFEAKLSQFNFDDAAVWVGEERFEI
jgi:hypothetical protein